MTNPPGAMPPLPLPTVLYTTRNRDGDPMAVKGYTASQLQAYAAPLVARVAELQADAARFQGLIRTLDWDGHGYWLPELCIRSRDFGEDFVPEPSIEELRTVIDAAIAAKD